MEVRNCKHLKCGHQCTIKIIKKDLINIDDCKAIVKDIKMLKKLDHPNIIKLHDAFQDKNNIYIVEEQFKGEELLEFIIK